VLVATSKICFCKKLKLMEQLVNFVIRPPRADYSPTYDLLEQDFILEGRTFRRKDLEVTNEHGHVLKCSHYVPHPIPEARTLPCVIYCHGNSGCRADASEAVMILLPSYITVFTLDFSGSGLSDGEYVTLGWREKDDLKAVVNFLRTDEQVSCIGLWGRSMGAVTSLMYGAEDPSIAGMVLDSPFANLVDLMMELVDVYKIRLPKFTVKVAVQYMRKVIQKKAHFDIMDLDVVKMAAKSFIPALFGHGLEDHFIQPHHSDLIYNSYAGDKNIIKFEGDHNSPRPQFYYDSISIFFHNVLHPPDDLIEQHASECLHEHFDGLENLEENVFHEIIGGPRSTQNDTTEDAIDHFHSRWQMSRTEVPFEFADKSEKTVGIIHAEDLSGQERKDEKSDAEGSSNKRDNRSDGIFDKNCLDAVAGLPTRNQVTDGSLDRFAHFPLSIDDEERMVMEAIIASLRDVETGEVSQNKTSQTSDTTSSQKALETTFQDISSGPEKEFSQATTSEILISPCMDGSQTQYGSPDRVKAQTETCYDSSAARNTSTSISEGSHQPGSFFQNGQ